MRAKTRIGLAVLAGVLWIGCGGDPYRDPTFDGGSRDGGGTADASGLIRPDAELADAATLPDRNVNPEGPVIEILEPLTGAVLSGPQVLVRARITDPDGVDADSVKAVIPGGDAFELRRSGQEYDVYEGQADLRAIPNGVFSMFVEAADRLGSINSALVDVERDTGPEIEFLEPLEGERYKGSTNLEFYVIDPNGVDTALVTAEVGGVELTITLEAEDPTTPGHPTWALYRGEIVFEDAMFEPALRGDQRITVRATNLDHGVTAEGTLDFTVDEEGPVITILTPEPAQILGGIIAIEADIQDPAGVSDPSVVAVLAHDSMEYEISMSPTGGGPYRGTFDTSQLPATWIFPSLSVRAADRLGNESEAGFLLALDNTPPVASLDPPPDIRVSKFAAGYLAVSHPFDPVGPGVPNDGQRVPQVFFLRARIEDRGNQATGLLQTPLSLVDQASVRLYVLGSASGKALVVDKTGDGRCDDINPQLVPTTNPQSANEVLALAMEAIPPVGAADYRDATFLPPSGYIWGPDLLPAAPTCYVNEGEGLWHAWDWDPIDDFVDEYRRNVYLTFSKVLFYSTDVSEPAIYALPPVTPASPLHCTGLQFDARANNIPENQWACVAVVATDHVGNKGVSRPLRVFVDYSYAGHPWNVEIPPPGAAPDCTGTWNPQTTVTDPTTPCSFNDAYTYPKQEFPSGEIRREDIQ